MAKQLEKSLYISSSTTAASSGASASTGSVAGSSGHSGSTTAEIVNLLCRLEAEELITSNEGATLFNLVDSWFKSHNDIWITLLLDPTKPDVQKARLLKGCLRDALRNTVTKNEGSKFPPMQEVSVETGEENKKAVFTADSALFEFTDGGWKERGKGELKINVPTDGTSKARLVMRARGNYRLLLNANLFPDMKLTAMDKKGITFACVNSAGEASGRLSTIALKFRDASFVEEFRAAVMENKGKSGVALKTPENSPKVLDE